MIIYPIATTFRFDPRVILYPYCFLLFKNRTLLPKGEDSRYIKCEQPLLTLRSSEVYKCSGNYNKLSVALSKNSRNFTKALSANGSPHLSSHSTWLPANACVWRLPMVFLTCIYLSQIRGSWPILGRQQLTNSLV